MRRLVAGLCALVAGCTSAVVLASPSQAAAADLADGRACSASACAVIHPDGQSDYGRRGHRIDVVYAVRLTGSATALSLDVGGVTRICTPPAQ